MPEEFLEEEASYILNQKAQKDSSFYKADPCFRMSVLQRSQFYLWSQSKINARGPFSEVFLSSYFQRIS